MERLLICIFITLCFLSASIVACIIDIGNCEIDYVEDKNDFRDCDGTDDLFTLCCVYDKLFYHIPIVPTYITTESYGGKMGAEFALVWYRAQKAGTIESNLKGITLGSAWISPIDTLMTWAPFLFRTGIVDRRSFDEIDTAAKKTKDKVETGEWKQAFNWCANMYNIILNVTYNVDIYNILTKKNYSSSYLTQQSVSSFDKDTIYKYFQSENLLEQLMNGPVKEALGLEVGHGNLSDWVYGYLTEDFLKPVTNIRISQILELLLNKTNLNVFVYNGHMDVMASISGTLVWLEKLKWKDANTWKNVTRQPLVIEDIVEGYFKAQNNFRMYWVIRAGHMVPKDYPAAMKQILWDLISNPNE